jgi:hypothetical protein
MTDFRINHTAGQWSIEEWVPPGPVKQGPNKGKLKPGSWRPKLFYATLPIAARSALGLHMADNWEPWTGQDLAQRIEQAQEWVMKEVEGVLARMEAPLDTPSEPRGRIIGGTRLGRSK